MKNVIKSRIIPFLPAQNNIHRAKLYKELSENIKKSLVLICSSAGYGKTSLVYDFLNKSGREFAWLQVHRDMDNFFTFISYLVSALAQIQTDFGKETLEIISSYQEKYYAVKKEKSIVNDVIGIFINEFCKYFEKDTIIVLDNLGIAGNHEWLKSAFNSIFENIPKNLHFIITTRNIPEFNLGILQAKRNIFRIGTNDLTLSTEEISMLLDNVYNTDCPENEASDLKIRTGGWVTGIHLLMQAYGNDYKKIKPDKILSHEQLFDYFAEDIFNSLDDDIKDFLIHTSLLENFSLSLCASLFGTGNSRRIIKELRQRNIFIQAETEAGLNEVYSYQPLFKTFLVSKLKELKNPEEIKEFYNKVYDSLNSSRDFIPAVRYAILSGNTPAAVPLILKNFNQLFDKGEFGIIWKWFEIIDEDTVINNPVLLYNKALLLKFYKGNITESLQLIDKALVILKSGDDSDFFAKCVISKTRNLLSLGQIKEAIILLNEIIDNDVSIENNTRIHYLLAYSYYVNSEYDNSISLLEEAIKVIDSGSQSYELKDTKIDIYNLLGHIYLIRGEYSKSIAYYEYVSKNAQNIIDKYETNCNLILLYSQSGKFELAEAYIGPTREIEEKIPIPIFKITFLLALQAFKFEFGEYEESIILLEEMNIIAAGLKHKYYTYLGYSLIADALYYLGRFSKCEEYYDLAFNYINDDNKLEKVQFATLKAILLKKKELVPSAEAVLLECYEYNDRNKFIFNKTQIAFHLADYYLKDGKLQLAYKFLSECLSVSREKEYFAYLQREYMDSKILFDFAIANNIEKEFVKMIIAETFFKSKAKWLSKESRIKLQKTEENLYDISISAFGTGSVKIRGRIISDSEWRKKKWKYILFYLFIGNKKEMTKDSVIDLFYPEYSPENGDNVFHQITSAFRGLLKADGSLVKTSEELNNDKPKKGSKNKILKQDSLSLISPLIIYEGKIVKLNKYLKVRVDVNEFENQCSLAASSLNAEKKIEHLLNAVALYKGNFLEGYYNSWCEDIRNKLKNVFININEVLIELFYESNQYEKAIYYSENLLKYDKLNEKAYQTIVRSYLNDNKKNLAKDKYLQMLKSYRLEIGEELRNSFTINMEPILR